MRRLGEGVGLRGLCRWVGGLCIRTTLLAVGQSQLEDSTRGWIDRVDKMGSSLYLFLFFSFRFFSFSGRPPR